LSIVSTAGNVADHHALFADEAVEQRGLPDVGAPHQRHLDRFIGRVFVRIVGSPRQPGLDRREEFVDPACVFGGHTEGLAQSESVKLVDGIVLSGAVDLVRDEKDRGSSPPQKRRDLLIQRGGARPAVDDEEDKFGLDERGLGLQENLPPESDVVPPQTSCVDDAEGARSLPHDSVDPIPRHSGLVGDQRSPLLHEAVEQRALSDVWSADYRDERKTAHGGGPRASGLTRGRGTLARARPWPQRAQCVTVERQRVREVRRLDSRATDS
jgi:hypothetical protein